MAGLHSELWLILVRVCARVFACVPHICFIHSSNDGRAGRACMRAFVCVHMCACVHLLHPLMDMQAVRACMCVHSCTTSASSPHPLMDMKGVCVCACRCVSRVCMCVYHLCFIHSSTDGHKGCACMRACVHMCVRVPHLRHPLIH